MNLLLVHNFYQQPGGEDQVFSAESRLMKDHGHHVLHFVVHNDQIAQFSRLALARSTIWNSDIYRKLRKVIQHEKPDIMHIHNTLPLISPAAYYAAKIEGIAIVQTLHNYRLLCPNALFFRDGHVCKDCMGKFVPWPGILHACYRNCRAATSMIAATLSVHRVLRTYNRMVDLYIALTNFARQKFIQEGLPAEKIVVKPNFIDPDPGIGDGQGGYAIFAGRLTLEKGIYTLLAAWEKTGGKIPLKIVGDGPLMGEVGAFVERQGLRDVDLMGYRAYDEVLVLMRKARILVFPSEWYETFGRVATEAFACGVPVIASRIGAMSEILEDGRTGLHFEPGNSKDLTAKVEWAWIHEKEMKEMGRDARKEYERKYTAEINYKLLMEIYKTAIERSRKKPAIQI